MLTRPRLSTSVAFYLQASILVSFLAGSSAPTPLYGVYQAQWGFSPITITVIFGIYAFAVLATLLTAGSLSDYVGRRPVLLAATGLQAAAMLVFATAGGGSALLIARILQGLATGAAAAAVGAGMLDIDRAKGTIANSVGPLTGTATGGIGSALMVQYLPAPTRLIYLVLFAIFVVQAVGVLWMPESVARKPGALASLRPKFGVPAAARQPFLLAVPVLVASWALVGFYGSLGPTLVRHLVGSTSVVLGGLSLFVLAGAGGAAVLVLRTVPQRTEMVLGIAALLVGVVLTLLAIDQASIAVFLAGTAVAGIGFGAGFQGAIRTVIPLAAAAERAGVLSVLYVVSYFAMGLPAVIAGLRVVHSHGDVLGTAREYGATVVVLAVLALLGAAVRRKPAVAWPVLATDYRISKTS